MTTTTPTTAAHAVEDEPTEARTFARTMERLCAMGGVIFAVLFGIGFLAIAQFVPPLDPSDSAAQIAATFREDTNLIRTGLLVSYVGTIFFLMFGSGILGQTRRIRGVPAAITYLQVSSFAAASTLIFLPMMIWLAAAFRPDTMSDESLQLLNDLGWIMFLIGFVPFVTWFVSTGVAILCDEDEASPLYPRWSGYLSLVMGVTQMTAMLLVFFKTGPFAWDGLFSWWLPATDFFAWFMIITVLTMKAINRRDYGSVAS